MKKAMVDIAAHVDVLKEQALHKLTTYLSVSLLFLLLILLHRLSDADWQKIYLLHFASIFLACIVTLLSKKLSYKSIIYSYLGLGLITSFVEYFSMGLAGIGEISSLFCIMLAFFYLDKRSTVIVGSLVFLIYCVGFDQFVNQGRSLSENDSVYLSWHSAWIGTFIGSAVFFMIIGMSINYLQSQIISLLKEVEQQKKTIENQKQQIEHLANHDALTGLPSLRVADGLIEDMSKLTSHDKHSSAILFLDLDGFKAVNDAHGHDAGDEVLKAVASRIRSEIRSNDIACRIGGDEFLVIIEKIDNQLDVENLCQRLIKAISSPLLYKSAELTVGVSIGAACSPGYPLNSKCLRIKADQLMYEVKNSGKNNYLISTGCPSLHCA